MKLQAGAIILLFMIFLSVVTGYLVVKTAYSKKNIENYKVNETIHSLQYGDISVERYFRNGMNVKAFGYYKDGTMKSEYYVTDNTGNSSKYISYFPNQQIETKSLKWFQNDSAQFLYEEYFENGNVRRREGSQISNWEYYDDNGEPTVFYYKKGGMTTEVMFFTGSRKQEESDFINGVRNGKWFQWDSTGKQIRNEYYKDGIKTR